MRCGINVPHHIQIRTLNVFALKLNKGYSFLFLSTLNKFPNLDFQGIHFIIIWDCFLQTHYIIANKMQILMMWEFRIRLKRILKSIWFSSFSFCFESYLDCEKLWMEKVFLMKFFLHSNQKGSQKTIWMRKQDRLCFLLSKWLYENFDFTSSTTFPRI